MNKWLFNLLSVILVGCSAAPSAQAFDRQRTEYAVYSQIIQERYLQPDTPQVVIQDQTAYGMPGENLDERLAYVKQQLPEADPELFTDFKKQNRSASQLEQRFTFQNKVILLSQVEQQEIFGGGNGWNKFYARFPGSPGLLTLSRVGFNQKADQALLYIGQSSNFLAGAGHMLWLVLENGRWIVKQQVMVWIS